VISESRGPEAGTGGWSGGAWQAGWAGRLRTTKSGWRAVG